MRTQLMLTSVERLPIALMCMGEHPSANVCSAQSGEMVSTRIALRARTQRDVGVRVVARRLLVSHTKESDS
jgi:hypothetical protein